MRCSFLHLPYLYVADRRRGACTCGHVAFPWDGVSITQTDAPYTCPVSPPFSKTLKIAPYYVDKRASVIDPQKLAGVRPTSEAPTHLGQFTSAAADAYLAKGSRNAAVCVYSLLDAAAKADAWTGRMPFQETSTCRTGN